MYSERHVKGAKGITDGLNGAKVWQDREILSLSLCLFCDRRKLGRLGPERKGAKGGKKEEDQNSVTLKG